MTYAGATALLDPDAGLQLDPDRWGWQPKLDGCYAVATTDAAGRIASVVSRTGRPLREAADLLGILAGAPHSQLVGELEAHTEAGARIAAARGHRLLHLFDCLGFDGAPVAALPYAARRGLLYRGHSLVEGDLLGHVRTWTDDATGRAHDAAGRYTAPIPRDLRRLPIVPLARGLSAARTLWAEHVERDGGEGLVAVRLDAPAGSRGAKRKIKTTDTTDARVLATDGRAITVETPRGDTLSLVSRFAASVTPGAVVEIAHHGRYESGAGPRFARVRREAEGARVVRLRADLSPVTLTDALVQLAVEVAPKSSAPRRHLRSVP